MLLGSLLCVERGPDEQETIDEYSLVFTYTRDS